MDSYLNIQIRVVKAQAEAQIRQLQLELSSLNKSMSTVGTGGGAGISNTTRSLSSLTNGLRAAGYAMSTAFTLPLVGAGRNILDFTLANQTAAADLKKVYGTDPFGHYNAALELLRKNFEALSDEYGVNQTEVIQIGAAWAQAGVQGKALAESVENTLKTMVIGDLSATESTNALIAIQGEYGASAKGLTAIINDLNVVENQTGISMGGLIQGFVRAGGSAADAGIDYQHLAAMLAALSPVAGSASQAGNALKTIISRLLVPTTAAAGLLKQMGINTKSATWEAANGTVRLQAMATAFEKLTGQQKAQVSAALASRFQISKFDVLMRDMNNYLTHSTGLSYYGESLTNTVDPAKNAEIANRELQTVLKSNPQLLKEVGATLKNSLSDTLTPLIPVILSVAESVSRMAVYFGQLNPNVQKAVGILLLVLAALGPVLLYVSAMGSAVHYMASAFSILGAPLKLIGPLISGLSAPFKWMIGGIASLASSTEEGTATMEEAVVAMSAAWDASAVDITAVLTEIAASVATTASIMTELWAAAMASMATETTVSMGVMTAEIGAGMTAIELEVGGAGLGEELGGGLLASLASLPKTILGFFSRIPSMIVGVLDKLPGLVRGAFRSLLPMLADFGSGLLDVITGPWGIAIAAVVGAVVIFRKQIESAWNGIVSWFQSGASGLGSVMGGIEQIFDSAGAFIVSMFNKLPAGVRGALQAVVNLVSEAAHDVYDLFSYLNPFAHHSPSLVENVTNGMAEVARQFASVTNIAGPIKQAYNEIKTFGTATANVMANAKASDMADTIKSMKSAGATSGGISAYKALSADLDGLNARAKSLNGVIAIQQGVVDADNSVLKSTNDTLTKQQGILDNLTKTQTYWNNLIDQAKTNIQTFSQTGITGQQKMSDAIFSNSQAQKQLQLEMMKMEDATGPIDDVQSRLSALAGEMELLRGQEAAARANGAGSDILSTYDSQISSLQGQSDASTQAANKYNALSDALSKLQNTGQELDLENSLKFDPLSRAIDKAANSMKELPFSAIMKGIQDNKANLDSYTASYNKATDAVNTQQKAVDAATAAHDAAQKAYDRDNDKLTVLQNAYSKIQSAIQDVSSALSDMTQAAQSAASAIAKVKKPKGAAAADGLDPSGPGFKPSVGKGTLNSSASTKGLQALTDAALANVKKTMDALDFVEPLKKKWGEAVAWWKTNISPGLNQFGHAFSGIFGHVNLGPAMKAIGSSSFVKVLGDIVSHAIALAHALSILFKPEVTKFFQNVTKAAQDLGREIGPTLMPLLKSLGNFLIGLYETLQPFIELIGVALIGAWKLFFSTLNGGLGPALHTIIGTLKGVIEFVTGFLNLLGDLMRGRWGKLWGDVLLIFKGVWDAISSLFMGVFKTFNGLVWGFVKGVAGFFEWLYNELVGHSIIPDMVNAIVSWIARLPGMIFSALGTLVTDIAKFFVNVAVGAYNGIVTGAVSLWNWFKSLPTTIKNYFAKGVTWLLTEGKNIIRGLGAGIVAAAKDVWTWFGNIDKRMSAYFNNGAAWLVSKGRAIINGLGSGIVTAAKDVWTWFGNVGSRIEGYFVNGATWLYNKGRSILNGLGSGIVDAARDVWSWLGNIGTRIEGYFTHAGSWLVSAGQSIASGLNSGIKAGLKDVAKTLGTPVYLGVKYAINPVITGLDYLPGVNISTISTSGIPHFASGGVVPGSHKRDDVPAYLTPGELVVPNNIVAQFGGPGSLMAALGFNGVKGGAMGSHFGLGGWLSNIGHDAKGAAGAVVTGAGGVISGVSSAALSGLKAAGSAISGAAGSGVGALSGAITGGFATFKRDVVDPATHLLRKGAANAFENSIGNPIKKADNFLDQYGVIGKSLDTSIDTSIDGIYNWLKGSEAASAKKAQQILNSSTNIGIGNHKAFMDEALTLAKHKPTAELEAALNTIITNESGWNPKAINLTDINAQEGHPSQGLMQTIPSTFEAYRLKSLPDVITNPMANVLAGIRYADAQYGGLLNVPGVRATAHGGGYIGYDSGGLLPTGLSSVFNGTGQPEVIAPPRVFDSLFAGATRDLENASRKLNASTGTSGRNAGSITYHQETHNTYNFGDLSFPNVKNGTDAGDFLKNLEIQAGGISK